MTKKLTLIASALILTAVFTITSQTGLAVDKYLPYLTPIIVVGLTIYFGSGKAGAEVQTLHDNLVLKWRDEVLTISTKLIDEQKLRQTETLEKLKIEKELALFKQNCQCQPPIERGLPEPELLSA